MQTKVMCDTRLHSIVLSKNTEHIRSIRGVRNNLESSSQFNNNNYFSHTMTFKIHSNGLVRVRKQLRTSIVLRNKGFYLFMLRIQIIGR